MNARHWIVLFVTATLFGSSFLLNKIAVASVPPIWLAILRVVIAAIAMSAASVAFGARMPKFGKSWGPLFVLGLLTAAIPYVGIAWGQSHIPSSLGGILFATIPIFTALIAPLMVAEAPLTRLRVLGIGLAFSGVVLAVGTPQISGSQGQMAGALATLLAAFSYSLGTTYSRRHPELSPMVIATGQLVTGSLILLPFGLIFVPVSGIEVTAPAAAAVLAVGLLSTALPVLLLFWLIRNAGASNASVVAFFIPVAAVVLGAVVMAEPITAYTAGGFALILLGAVLTTRKGVTRSPARA